MISELYITFQVNFREVLVAKVMAVADFPVLLMISLNLTSMVANNQNVLFHLWRYLLVLFNSYHIIFIILRKHLFYGYSLIKMTYIKETVFT